MPTKKQIVLVDDHVIIRNGLKELIEKLGPYKINQQYDNGSAFLNDIKNQSSAPDLVIMDLSMPDMNGVEVMQQLQQLNIK